MSLFQDKRKSLSAPLDHWLGQTWYVTTEGSNVYHAIRVRLGEQQDRNDVTGQTINALRNKVIQIYKDPETVIGGVRQGGLARPIVDEHQFIAEADVGNPHAVLWVVAEILADDALTWTLRTEQKQRMQVGRTNIK